MGHGTVSIVNVSTFHFPNSDDLLSSLFFIDVFISASFTPPPPPPPLPIPAVPEMPPSTMDSNASPKDIVERSALLSSISNFNKSALRKVASSD